MCIYLCKLQQDRVTTKKIKLRKKRKFQKKFIKDNNIEIQMINK